MHDEAAVYVYIAVLREMFGSDVIAVAQRQLDAATERMAVVWSAIIVQLTVTIARR